jgi:hypothetical protein
MPSRSSLRRSSLGIAFDTLENLAATTRATL